MLYGLMEIISRAKVKGKKGLQIFNFVLLLVAFK